MPKRPSVISIRNLAKAVENAVKITSEKHKVQFSSQLRIVPGPIVGRELIQADMSLKQALQIATEITQHVTGSQGTAPEFAADQFEPAVLATGGGGGTTVGMKPPAPDLNLE